jgi:predicted site-specific integrase-resolvase
MSLETKSKKRLIGYARVSTQQQDITRQTDLRQFRPERGA